MRGVLLLVTSNIFHGNPWFHWFPSSSLGTRSVKLPLHVSLTRPAPPRCGRPAGQVELAPSGVSILTSTSRRTQASKNLRGEPCQEAFLSEGNRKRAPCAHCGQDHGGQCHGIDPANGFAGPLSRHRRLERPGQPLVREQPLGDRRPGPARAMDRFAAQADVHTSKYTANEHKQEIMPAPLRGPR